MAARVWQHEKGDKENTMASPQRVCESESEKDSAKVKRRASENEKNGSEWMQEEVETDDLI